MVRLDLTFEQALRIDVLYWTGDLLKTTIVALDLDRLSTHQ